VHALARFEVPAEGELPEIVIKLKKGFTLEAKAVLVFSEFGRHIEENGSKGTHHGAAGPVLLVGSSVAGGKIGGVPDLANLDEGDVRFEIDFRDLYALLLADWLRVNPASVIDRGKNGKLELFHS
jgi:uncharacterized protein (DUF1501 family)